MEQTVYADLLFMINFSMDFLCLYLVAKLLARRFSLLRCALSSTVGGLYAVCSLLLPFPSPLSFVIDLVVCLLMCFVAFFSRKETPLVLVLVTASFFLASLLLGGIMTFIFNLLNRHSPPLQSFADTQEMPLWLFALIAAISSLLTWLGSRLFRTRSQIKSADVEIRVGKKKTVLHAMCDSGNLVRDAVSGKPVIISDKRQACNLLPVNCPPIGEWRAEILTDLPPDIAARVRIIPTGTADGECLMFALRPDSIVIRMGNQKREADALVGFGDVRHTLMACNALLPSELVI